ncbi:MAG: M56 family metallopeptidase [Peptostreptococcaceae bacterium]|jgi:bla regulator protein BlaR1|nr:M56 family metallopeptidase [Peptostreptococcaceae bacterium]
MLSYVELISDFFDILLQMSFRSSLLIVIIFMIKYIFKSKINPKMNYIIWYLLLVSLMIPYFPESNLSIYNIGKNLNDNPSIKINIDDIQILNNEVFLKKSSEKKIKKEVKNYMKYRYLIAYIWFFGFIILVCYVYYKNFNFYKDIKENQDIKENKKLEILKKCKSMMKIKKSIKLIESKNIKIPIVVGLISYNIILPKNIVNRFSDKNIEYIILHELSHIKRNDLFINWIILILQLIYWFNPLIWIAFIHMKDDMELACDALVLEQLEEKEYISYAKVIVDFLEYLSESKFSYISANLLEKNRNLKRRIIMIKNFKKNSYKITFLGLFMIALVGCTSITSSVSEENIILEEDSNNEESKMNLPPKELIKNNFDGTDISVALETVSSNLELRENQSLENLKLGEYIVYEIEGKIINSYKGKYKIGDSIKFAKVIEYGGEESLQNPFLDKKFIGSFVYGESDYVVIPEVAYVFAYSKDLNELFIDISKE